MRGDIKQLLEFFRLVGHVEYEYDISDKVKKRYRIKLIPDHSEISSFQLSQLQKIVEPNKVKIWFFYNQDSEENECNIEIEVLPRK